MVVIMKKQCGFSLIEALISIVVLTVGLLGAVKMQANMSAATQLSRQRGDALSMASNQLEILRDSGVCTTSNSGPITPTQGSASYNMAVTCDGTHKIPTVTVNWNDAKGVSNRVQLTTSL